MRQAGFHHSEETRQKIREANLLRAPANEGTRRQQSNSAKIRARRGISEETRQRMAEGQRAKHARARARTFCEQQNLPLEEYEREIASGNEWCKKCRTFKPIAVFSSKKSICLGCLCEKNQGWYVNNRESVLRRKRERYAENANGEQEKTRELSLRRYGASIKWYNDKLTEQGFGCAICGSRELPKGHTKFSVDHNHKCCAIRKGACDKCRRGLLCSYCNHALERIETDPQWGIKALAYLGRYS